MAISDETREVFAELQRAFKNDDAALLECRYKATGEIVHVICAVNPGEDGGAVFVPFAIMPLTSIMDAIDPPFTSHHPKEMSS